MGRLSHVTKALERANAGEPIPDDARLVAALEAIAARIKTPDPTDLSPHVQALLKGLAPLLVQKEADLKPHVEALIRGLKPAKPQALDLAPLIKAVQGLTLPEAPDIAFPEAGPYTFDIERDNNGYMRRVIATPGRPEKESSDSVAVE